MNFPAQARFFHQLASLLDAGIPLTRGFALAASASKSSGSRWLKQASEAINAGSDLATAIASYPPLWDRWTTTLLRLAEQSGTLAPMCHHLAESKHRQARLQRLYRAIAVAAGLIVWSISLLILAIVIGNATVLMQAKAWGMALIGLIVCLGIADFLARDRGRKLAFLAALPSFSILFRAQAMQQLADLAIPLAAGIPVATALTALRRENRDRSFAIALKQVSQQSQQGSPLSQSLSQHLPADVLSIVQTGEAVGDPSALLAQIGTYYAQTEELNLKQLKSFLLSLSLMSIGALIAGLGLWGLSSLFKGVYF